MNNSKIKIGDRVTLAEKEGLRGLVKDVRAEVTAKGDQKDKGLLVSVLWDNGTLSYFSPEKLKVIELV